MKTIYTYSAIIAFLFINFNVNANNSTLPEGIVYQLVVKSADMQISRTIVSEYPYLRKVMTAGNFEYQFGKYTNYDAVSTVKNNLENAGCTGVNILAYNNHNQIPVSEAISLQFKNDIIQERVSAKRTPKNITTKEVNYLLQVQQSGLKHYYSLAIPIASVETVDMILEEIDNEQVIEISVDENLYSIGRYENFEDVIAARKQFIESEIYDVFIMAQITDERIDAEDTNNLALTIQSVVNELASK